MHRQIGNFTSKMRKEETKCLMAFSGIFYFFEKNDKKMCFSLSVFVMTVVLYDRAESEPLF